MAGIFISCFPIFSPNMSGISVKGYLIKMSSFFLHLLLFGFKGDRSIKTFCRENEVNSGTEGQVRLPGQNNLNKSCNLLYKTANYLLHGAKKCIRRSVYCHRLSFTPYPCLRFLCLVFSLVYILFEEI